MDPPRGCRGKPRTPPLRERMKLCMCALVATRPLKKGAVVPLPEMSSQSIVGLHVSTRGRQSQQVMLCLGKITGRTRRHTLGEAGTLSPSAHSSAAHTPGALLLWSTNPERQQSPTVLALASSWKTIFPRTGVEYRLQDASSAFHLLCPFFLLL